MQKEKAFFSHITETDMQHKHLGQFHLVYSKWSHINIVQYVVVMAWLSIVVVFFHV